MEQLGGGDDGGWSEPASNKLTDKLCFFGSLHREALNFPSERGWFPLKTRERKVFSCKAGLTVVESGNF